MLLFGVMVSYHIVEFVGQMVKVSLSTRRTFNFKVFTNQVTFSRPSAELNFLKIIPCMFSVELDLV